MEHRRRPGHPPGAYTTWRAARVMARGLFGMWFPLEVRGDDPPPGPLVIAANHFSHLDPVVVGIAVPRPLRYLAVDELYGRSRFFDALTLWLGTIPTTRTRIPLGPLRLALDELAAGGSVGLFPEGVRVARWDEIEPKRGAAWLAHRAGVPLHPVAVAGTDLAMGRDTKRISRRPIVVTNCEPLYPADFAGDDDPVSAMMAEWRVRIGRALGSG